MMKKLLHKSFSVLMAFLLLFSTVSFTVEKHYCGDVLVDVAVFTEAQKCAMEAFELLQKKTCCKNEVDVVKGQEVVKTPSFEDLDFEQQLFLQTFTHTYFELFESDLKQTIPHKNYSPPNLVADIQLLDQVFII